MDEQRVYYKIIISEVCNFYSISKEDLFGDSRIPKFTHPRKILYYLLRTRTKLSASHIGRIMSKDHSTIQFGCTRVEKLLEDKDEETCRDIIAFNSLFEYILKDRYGIETKAENEKEEIRLSIIERLDEALIKCKLCKNPTEYKLIKIANDYGIDLVSMKQHWRENKS